MLLKIHQYKNFLIRFAILSALFLGLPLSAETLSGSWFSGIRKSISEGISSGTFDWTSGFLLIAGGVLASLLPCVYPLYPITVGIVRARGEGSPRILHPAIYYFGLITIYASFGLIAGLSGGAFNVILRYPIVNLALSVLIFLLALGSLDLIHLPFFQSKEVKTVQGCGGTFSWEWAPDFFLLPVSVRSWSRFFCGSRLIPVRSRLIPCFLPCLRCFYSELVWDFHF
ncbi:cytochrome C biogenesis protein transmembrane region domain protein [Leptospira borgpetersenii str. 200701203]|uniref:Cytochrome C biogenesis protein transmembrane region domain protein n=1 Tax=Leptospira borgpetersenii str. 200701203 TaxID=1193007 RepID=M3FJ14_LEPBO|nr:cytochrome C biogenesis protein transmembrane region domain protein [Leptospira borgpetersenii str. 200701203]